MSCRVLYVDDEADIREVAAMALELDPLFEVRTCASGAEALAVASEWRPELVLLDVMMPEMDGPTAFQHLRRAYPALSIIFMTARTLASEVRMLKELGALAVIGKPFDPMTLAATVRGYL